jgi:Zn-dependent alcohol dehydrogenase
MRSARIVKTNKPLVIEYKAVPKPKNSEVLVRVKAAGIAIVICIYGKEVIWVLEVNL